LKQVENLPGFVRDEKTSAIICTDQSGLQAYKAKKKAAAKVDILADEISDMKNEIGEIKELLLALVEGNNT